MEMVQGRHFLVSIANVCEYKILRFWANPQKYQTLVPANNSHLKILCVLSFISVPTHITCIYTHVSIFHEPMQLLAPWR